MKDLAYTMTISAEPVGWTWAVVTRQTKEHFVHMKALY